jgi:hypothetical protein
VESTRGNIASWLLIGFGLAYFVWGLRRAWKDKPHRHPHLHDHGAGVPRDAQDDDAPREPTHIGAASAPRPVTDHLHEHIHSHARAEHAHVHDGAGGTNLTPWILFTIFVFGPCEPLIPLIMYPAARHSLAGVALVAAAFGAVTIATMLVIIAAASWGASFARLGKLEKYSHALAGLMIFVSGLAVQFLGL